MAEDAQTPFDQTPLAVAPADPSQAGADDDELEAIRYSLTALGERLLAERRGPRFRGFGPCMMVA